MSIAKHGINLTTLGGDIAALDQLGAGKMHTGSDKTRSRTVDENYFERKGRDLVVADDEIEAGELDTQDLDGLGCPGFDPSSID